MSKCLSFCDDMNWRIPVAEGREKGVQFLQEFLMVASAIFLFGMSAYALAHRKNTGSAEVALLGVLAVIWTTGTFLETQCAGYAQKLFWRDVQQLGVFGLPLGTVMFAAAYTNSRRLRPYVRLAAAISALAVLLIWTNPLHHMMRSGVYLQESSVFGTSLVIHTTVMGTLLVAYNFSLPLFAVLILLNYARRLNSGFRKQVYWITASFAFTFFVAFIKSAFLEKLGIFVHISVLYIPSAIVLFLSLFRYSFFQLSPIARDKVFDVIGQGILVLDKDGLVMEANSAAIKTIREFSGYAGTPVGCLLKEIFDPEHKMDSLLKNGLEQKREIQIHRETGDIYLSLAYYPLGGERDGSVLILNNITSQKMYEQHLRWKAELDGLTGLLNRTGFENAYEDMRAAMLDKKQCLSMLMMDLDNFKGINDTFGHTTGDKVLVHFARIMRSSLREEDVVGRVGGEEFAVLLPGTQKEEALRIAERIRKKVCESTLPCDGRDVKYTVSIGVTDNNAACNVLKDRGLTDALAEADAALYKAKRKNRNCTVVYGQAR